MSSLVLGRGIGVNGGKGGGLNSSLYRAGGPYSSLSALSTNLVKGFRSNVSKLDCLRRKEGLAGARLAGGGEGS